jgi:transcription elongation factor Elf1
MKTCNRCKEEKPLNEFNKKRESGPQPYCKPCQSEYQREIYAENRVPTLENIYVNRNVRKRVIREFLADFYSSHPCVDCGETDIVVLEFDHITDKEFGINLAIRDVMKIDRVKEELEKGEVRCSNCHRKVTAERTRNWRWRYQNGFDLEDMDYTIEE